MCENHRPLYGVLLVTQMRLYMSKNLWDKYGASLGEQMCTQV